MACHRSEVDVMLRHGRDDYQREKGWSQRIDARLREDRRRSDCAIPVMLDGLPGSGVSTYRRHMYSLFSTSNTPEPGRYDESNVVPIPMEPPLRLLWPDYRQQMIPMIQLYTIQIIKSLINDYQRVHYNSTSLPLWFTDIQRCSSKSFPAATIMQQFQIWWNGSADSKSHDTGVHTTTTSTGSSGDVRRWWLAHVATNGYIYPSTQSSNHFFDRAHQIVSSSYEPIDLDVILCPTQLDDIKSPVATISANQLSDQLTIFPMALVHLTLLYFITDRPVTPAILETPGLIDGFQFVWMEVNQPLSSHRKWVHSFESVRSVIWFCDITDCFRPVVSSSMLAATSTPSTADEYGGNSQMRLSMEKWLNCYSGSRWFTDTYMIVVLTHYDTWHHEWHTHGMDVMDARMKHYWTDYQPSATRTIDASIQNITEYLSDKWHGYFVHVTHNRVKQIYIQHVSLHDIGRVKTAHIANWAKDIVIRTCHFTDAGLV